MISLARVSLVWAWRRFSPTVLIVGFAGLLVLTQRILRLESFRTVQVALNRSAADLWVGDPKTKSANPVRDISAHIEALQSSHHDFPNVEFPLGDSRDLCRNHGSSALAAADRRALDEPGTVVVDASSPANSLTHATPLRFP